jgi:serine/threonine-protein kinase
MTNNPVTIKLENVTFQLQEEHDFDWLKKFGKVFEVFDQQDSGNISFGVEKNGEKLFIKYAGAKMIKNFYGNTQVPIENLRAAVKVYQQLRHPYLIELVDHFEVNSGYATIFKWFDGETLNPHWSFPSPAKYNDPNSPFYRFKHLSVEQRLISLNRIFSFHEFVENKGFVAIDFFDGSLLFDFVRNEIKICDIDLYQKKPHYNNTGNVWGSRTSGTSRFMCPEEFILGAEIDECSNVFTMGATAFALLGGELDRSFAKWEAGKGLYEVALKAVNANRQSRYSNVSEFKAAWDSAINCGDLLR